MTRGERNNNPGNIDRNGQHWQGMAADQSGDPRFIVFTSPEFGIRALARLVLNYHRDHNLNTVRGIINRWAPPVENDTGAYVHAVCNACGVEPDDTVDPQDPKRLAQIVRGIIKEENGRILYEDSTIAKAIEMALT